MSRHKRGPGEGSDLSLRKEPPKGEEDGAFFEEKLPALRALKVVQNGHDTQVKMTF